MELKQKNQKYSVESQINGNDLLLKLNGETIKFSGKRLSENSLTFLFNNKSYTSYFTENKDTVFVNIDGENYFFDKISEDDKSYGLDSANSANEENIKTPMPGSIVKILVNKGQKVSEGDGLIIVEAMKMETTLYSSIDGIIAEVNVKAGEQVDLDKIMIKVVKE
jgi:biotin carboxyl carrier protein